MSITKESESNSETSTGTTAPSSSGSTRSISTSANSINMLGGRLALILKRMTVEIPHPYRAPPKAQKSWAGLKVGDTVQWTGLSGGQPTKTTVSAPQANPSSTQSWSVVSADSQGVTLDNGTRIEDRELLKLGHWQKVAKRRTRKDPPK